MSPIKRALWDEQVYKDLTKRRRGNRRTTREMVLEELIIRVGERELSKAAQRHARKLREDEEQARQSMAEQTARLSELLGEAKERHAQEQRALAVEVERVHGLLTAAEKDGVIAVRDAQLDHAKERERFAAVKGYTRAVLEFWITPFPEMRQRFLDPRNPAHLPERSPTPARDQEPAALDDTRSKHAPAPGQPPRRSRARRLAGLLVHLPKPARTAYGYLQAGLSRATPASAAAVIVASVLAAMAFSYVYSVWLAGEKRNLQSRVVFLTEEKDRLENERKDFAAMETKVASLEAQLASATKQSKVMEEQRDEANRKREQEVTDARKSLEKATEDHAKAIQRIAADANKELAEQLKTRDDAMTALGSKIEDRDKAIRSLEEQLRNANAVEEQRKTAQANLENTHRTLNVVSRERDMWKERADTLNWKFELVKSYSIRLTETLKDTVFSGNYSAAKMEQFKKAFKGIYDYQDKELKDIGLGRLDR